MNEQLDTGSILSQSFSILSRNLVPFVGVTAVVVVPGMVLLNYAGYEMARSETGGQANPFLAFLAFVAAMLIYGLSVQLATTGLVYGVFQQLRDQPVSLGECFSRAFGALGRVLGVAIVVGLLTGIGAMLCCIPGMILMTMWYVALPCAVIESIGVAESMRRSATLTSGNRWRVFFVVLALGLIFGVIQAILNFFLLGHPMAGLVVQDAISVIGTTVSAIASSLVYFQLRRMKESEFDVEQLATVFD